MTCKTSDEWFKELNDLARPLGCRVVYKWWGCRVVYKWWCFYLYKTDPETGIEYYVDGLDSIQDIEDYLKELEKEKDDTRIGT